MRYIRIIVSCSVLVNSLYGSYFKNDNVIVVTVPVADCLGKPATEIEPTKKAEEVYAKLGFSPETGADSCPRIHQVLRHEAGLICRETEEELLVEFPHFYYLLNNEKVSKLWLLKRVGQRAQKMRSEVIQALPEPLNHEKPAAPDDRILTLVQPWQDPKTHEWYSVGTRFTRRAELDNADDWVANVVDFTQDSVRSMVIKKVAALIHQPMTLDASRHLFTGLLRAWLIPKAPEGFGEIAYVWGGNSYAERFPCGFFAEKESVRGDHKITNWQRNDQGGVVTGFDCSGLVLRAAQAVGLNYFCKNTTTIGLTLKDVPSEEPLHAGDLILIPGHVMIISNVSESNFIDAVSYSSGFGCVREISCVDAFIAVRNFDALRALVEKKKRYIYVKKMDRSSSQFRGFVS